MSAKLGVIVKGYPRLSETFIAQEIRSLEQAGIPLEIISLRFPTDKKTHPVHKEIEAGVSYLPEYLHHEPVRVLKGLLSALIRPRFWRVLGCFLSDLCRDRSRNRLRRFGQALVLAREMDPSIRFLYAHFLHTPSSVCMYAAMLKGIDWAASAHAKDIWTSEPWELTKKLGHLRWVTTCTRYNVEYLSKLAPVPGRVRLLYHGLDLDNFTARVNYSGRTGAEPEAPVRLLSVGRAVNKKGYDILLKALALLPKKLHWQLTHIGGGELLPGLKEQAEKLEVDDRIQWLGSQSQQQVLEFYRQSDLFVLPCRVDHNGDRDGLPNVLMEAQSQGLAVVSTPISAIPELIEDGANGLLVAPEDPKALAAALEKLMQAPALRQQLGHAGQAKVQDQFNHDHCIGDLIQLLRASGV